MFAKNKSCSECVDFNEGPRLFDTSNISKKPQNEPNSRTLDWQWAAEVPCGIFRFLLDYPAWDGLGHPTQNPHLEFGYSSRHVKHGLGQTIHWVVRLGGHDPRGKKHGTGQAKQTNIKFVSWGLGTPTIGSGSICTECCIKHQHGRPSLRPSRDRVWFSPVELLLLRASSPPFA